MSIEEEPSHDSKLFAYSLNDNKAKSRVIKITGLRRCNLFTFPNFCKLLESLRLSITSTNENQPKACFSNTISPYFSRVCKVSRTDKLRYRVQPTASCRALLSTGRASALAMTWV